MIVDIVRLKRKKKINKHPKFKHKNDRIVFNVYAIAMKLGKLSFNSIILVHAKLIKISKVFLLYYVPSVDSV